MKRNPRNPLVGREEPQLGLFDEPEPAGGDSVEQVMEEQTALVRRLPEGLRLGTSSWTFPGWAGLVYHRRYPSQRAFLRESLREYAAHPLMRTVGIDRSYYAPVPREELREYASQLPTDFRCAMKVWQRISMPVFPRHARYGPDAGKPNRDFLDPDLFASELFEPVRDSFRRHMGPWILEVAPSPTPLDPAWFVRKLAAFLRAAPSDFPFTVELRDRRLLTRQYAQTLCEHGAFHVFNYWSRMPGLVEQTRVEGLVGGALSIVRLLLPPGAKYAELKDAYAPFDRLVDPQPRMRQEVKQIAEAALARGAEVYVLVNNKAEGSSPLTVQALAELLAH